MPPKRSKKKRLGKQRHPQNVLEVIIRDKAKQFVAAEREYWRGRRSIRENMQKATDALSLMAGEALPVDLSSTVWGLKDGVAFVRHKAVGKRPGVEFRIIPITLAEWGNEGLLVPLEKGEISLARVGLVRGLGHITFINCFINDIHIPYAELSHLRYGEIYNEPGIERAILDFQLTLLGLQTQKAPKETFGITARNTIEQLETMANEFEGLLTASGREEDLQRFLKDHSFVLHQSAEIIPKQKLGEDFVTDFVLVATTTQGPTYVLVELERASHPVLTEDLTIARPVNYAIKQTRDWDVWLEKNKAYIQNKLPGFETPSYLIVIGRSHDFDETQKTYMRSYNREWRNIELLTYDDVLARFRGTIEKLKATVSE